MEVMSDENIVVYSACYFSVVFYMLAGNLERKCFYSKFYHENLSDIEHSSNIQNLSLYVQII